MTLREIKPDKKTPFRISKKGVVWVKMNDQGQNNRIGYVKTVLMTNSRCQRPGYKHRYCDNDKTVVYPVKYKLWNATDGIPCDFDREYDTIKEAEEGIQRLRDGFKHQGYYRTNHMEKIAIEDINYQIQIV